jgi:deazaflavin-dependent oxidoreductase (nitroreductase family)
MPTDFTLKTMNAIHRGLLTISGGHLGWEAAKMPVLELTTVGRKSGEPRSVMLTSPYQEGDTLVIVASRGGDDHHPAWFLNLEANPAVEVSTKGKRNQKMTARVANPDERARMWPEITKKYSNYAGYQNRTTREIPVVLLEPVER